MAVRRDGRWEKRDKGAAAGQYGPVIIWPDVSACSKTEASRGKTLG